MMWYHLLFTLCLLANNSFLLPAKGPAKPTTAAATTAAAPTQADEDVPPPPPMSELLLLSIQEDNIKEARELIAQGVRLSANELAQLAPGEHLDGAVKRRAYELMIKPVTDELRKKMTASLRDEARKDNPNKNQIRLHLVQGADACQGMLSACLAGSLNALTILYEFGYQPNDCRESLLLAVIAYFEVKHKVAVVTWLLDHGVDPNGKKGESPLARAVELSNKYATMLPIIKLLLDAGASRNIQDNMTGFSFDSMLRNMQKRYPKAYMMWLEWQKEEEERKRIIRERKKIMRTELGGEHEGAATTAAQPTPATAGQGIYLPRELRGIIEEYMER